MRFAKRLSGTLRSPSAASTKAETVHQTPPSARSAMLYKPTTTINAA